MSDDQAAVSELHSALKPRAVRDYADFFLSRTRSEWQESMAALIAGDLAAAAGSGIAYAYIDPQVISTARTLTMRDGERYGNTALFGPPRSNSIVFAARAIIEMQVWFPVTDNASGAALVFFVLNKGGTVAQRSAANIVGTYVSTMYLGVMEPDNDVSVMAVAPTGSIQITEGGYATIVATPCA